jgi:hypothetical protein
MSTVATLRAGDIYTLPDSGQETFNITSTKRLVIGTYEKEVLMEETYPQWFLDAHCESRVPLSEIHVEDTFVHRAPDESVRNHGKKILVTEKRKREQQREKIATDRGKKALHNVLDMLKLDKYENNMSIATLDIVREMSIVEIRACLAMTDAHATLLFQPLQQMDDDIIANVDLNTTHPPPVRCRAIPLERAVPSHSSRESGAAWAIPGQ